MRNPGLKLRISRRTITRLTAVCLFLAPLVVVARQVQQTLKVDVNLVSVFVTAQDDKGGFVTDLDRKDFVVYDDNEPQEIAVFEKDEAVRSVLAVLMDTSGSMIDILPFMNRGVRDFARTISAPDQYFVITFGTGVRIVHQSTESLQHLDQVLQNLRPWGTSLLFDAMNFGLDKVNASSNQRKALIVFTDGEDNGSTLSYGRVVEEAQRKGALLYFVAIGSPVLIDKHTVETLANNSGGRTFYVPKSEPVGPYLDKIHKELLRQYYLGYYMPPRPGFHRIRVEVPGRPDVRIHTKTGYIGS